MPATAKELGVKNALNPRENIDGGAKYLAQMLQEFNGDTRLATAAYNAGPNAVKKYNGIPPYQETQVYVERVNILYKRYKKVS
jgi:soluble lytic murein transglycosylase-like protein